MLLLTILMSIIVAKTFAQTNSSPAYDITVNNKDGVPIYYRWINDETELEVCYKNNIIKWSGGGGWGGYVDNTTQPESDYSGFIDIPEFIDYNGNSYRVTSIGESAFVDCNNLTSVSIPNSVMSISHSAFYGCSSLTSVHISDIAAWCNIMFNDNPLNYAHHLYMNGEEIKDLVIPNSVTSISSSAFSGCSGLISAIIPNSVTSIGDSVFLDCKGLISVIIPNSVTSIDKATFSGCISLTSVTLSNSVTTISNNAFEGCSGLTSVTLPNSVTTIGNNAFSGCRGLISVVIGSGVTSIADNAFSNTNIYKVIWLTNTLPSGYDYVKSSINYVSNEHYYFNNKIVYPFLSSYFEVDGIRYVPISPSDRTCDAIDCVYNESAEDTNISATTVYKGITMTVKNIQPYFAYNNRFIKRLIVDIDGEITYNAFRGCSNVKSVTLGAKVSAIGEYAFQACSFLEAIDIPDAVKSIGSYAFSGCSGILSAKIGSGIETINNYSFSGCSSMKELTIGSQVKIIDQYAFQNCKALPSIIIPRAVTEIRDYVFYGCSNLKKVIMNDSEEELKLGSNGSTPFFSSCPLDSVYIGRNLSYKTIQNCGYSPFYRVTSLRAVKITDKETEISANEFYGCTNLQRVIIGDGVTAISDWAFSGCSSLKYFSFGSKVQSIGKEAFSDCVSVVEISSKSSIPPTCGSQALDDINKWECKLFVPNGCMATYQTADQWKDFFFIEEKGTDAEKKGDANGDGIVNAADIVIVVNYIMGNKTDRIHINAADVNGDGVINAEDISKIMNIIMGK